MNIFLVAQQMLILFSLMAAGFLLRKIHWIDEAGASRLSFLVVNLFNPFLVISSVFGKTLSSTGTVFWENLILIFLFYLILFAAGLLFVFAVRADSSEAAVYRMLTLLPNCGFMGIPVVASLLGTEYVIYVAVYMLAYNILLYTYGIRLVQKSKSQSDKETLKKTSLSESLRSIFLNFGVASSLLALLLFFLGITVPKGVQTFCDYMGSPCIPLSMMLIGSSVADTNLPSLLKSRHVYAFVFMKLLIIPIACTFLIRILPFNTTILKLFVILLSMPAGSMVVLVTGEYDGNLQCATAGVILSTLASIITIPFVTLFL